MFVLRNLKTRGQVRVKIIFPVEMIHPVYRAFDGFGSPDRFFDDGSVRHRKRSGMAHADRANRRIRFLAPSVIVTAAKHLRFRVHLRMDLQADNGFQFHGEIVGVLSYLNQNR